MRPILLALLLHATTTAAVNLQIPSGHPRIWYGNAARLAQAQTYFGSTPFTPQGNDIQFERALRGLLTANNGDCDAALAHLNGWLVENHGNRRDALRQQGEELLLIYDWCHHRLTPAQIQTLVARWNGYMDVEIADDFANHGAEANNYFWGRVRNELIWGITSFGENPRAQEFINHALDTRFSDWFADFYQDFGRGGVFPEGADYGVVSLSYPILPFASAADYGFDPYAQTPYYREAIYALLYGTTPGPTTLSGSFSGGALLFPFNDDETLHQGGTINAREYLGDFARWMGARAPTSGNARHIRAWLTQTGAGRRWMFDALGGSGNLSDYADLPLDYYAPGAGVFSSRTGHDAAAMQVQLQLGTPGHIEHRHQDGGSFQVWRKGRFLSRESAGYADNLRGFMGAGPNIDTGHPLAHNTLLFEAWNTGRWVGSGPIVIPPGQPRFENPRDLPRVTRLQHEPAFSFVAIDYSDAYRNMPDSRVDWPYADQAWREFVFIRPLQALVILDRTHGSADSLLPWYNGGGWLLSGPHVAAAQVRRSFILHFETQPVAAGNRLSAALGTQTAELITLIPAAPVYRVIHEDVPGDEQAGQYRLELDSVGSVDGYFLNVVTGYDAGEAPLGATLSEDASSWTLSLTHPVRGNASLTLFKGMTSAGGSLTIGAITTPLRNDVQGISVTSERPVWAGGDAVFANGFE
ncbi:MAG: hypothetical protein IT479_16480 [Xanthomonadales bacterium]|nr:hypothetical protein [Xanthomonadales bacterium]MCC6594858.1 hypothetical protein [Xanthomonadales bacterium]MCE7930103.1 hypothetical protein [Xanthomonadales bacterium PRO6]